MRSRENRENGLHSQVVQHWMLGVRDRSDRELLPAIEIVFKARFSYHLYPLVYRFTSETVVQCIKFSVLIGRNYTHV